MIKAEIIKDSINEFDNRITTFRLTFPRFILAELNTHRMFSKNSASSRAIPFNKMVQSIKDNPFIPIAWQKDHKGMQGTEYITSETQIDLCINAWLQARDAALTWATYLNYDPGNNTIGVTKQLCNRLLEPFMWHTVLLTATDFENFFELRCPKYKRPYYVDNAINTREPSGYTILRSKKDYLSGCTDEYIKEHLPNLNDTVAGLKLNEGQAEIHMMALAEAMWDAYNESKPELLVEGQWHIPYCDKIDYVALQRDLAANCSSECEDLIIKIATAKCARVSYTRVGEEGKPMTLDQDLQLHDRLKESGHWSPFEHCAKATGPEYYGNFKGWLQYRKFFHYENIK